MSTRGTIITIRFEVNGDPDDVRTVVDGLLDNGAFQDPINDHDADVGRLHVTSATIAGVEAVDQFACEDCGERSASVRTRGDDDNGAVMCDRCHEDANE